MVVGAKVCDLTEDLLWFVCGLFVGILMSPLIGRQNGPYVHSSSPIWQLDPVAIFSWLATESLVFRPPPLELAL